MRKNSLTRLFRIRYSRSPPRWNCHDFRPCLSSSFCVAFRQPCLSSSSLWSAVNGDGEKKRKKFEFFFPLSEYRTDDDGINEFRRKYRIYAMRKYGKRKIIIAYTIFRSVEAEKYYCGRELLACWRNGGWVANVIKVHWHWPASIGTELRPDGRMR